MAPLCLVLEEEDALRFISPMPDLRVSVLKPQKQLVNTDQGPRMVDYGDQLMIKFSQGGLSPWEYEFGIKHFEGHLRGVAHGVDKRHRLGCYDTETEAIINHWTDEFREKVEKAMLAASARSNGLSFIAVDRPKLRPPWPNYDQLVAQGARTDAVIGKQIVTKLKEDGYEPGEVLAYEQENLNRQAVIEAIREYVAEVENDQHGVIADVTA